MERSFFVVANPASGRQKTQKILREVHQYFSDINCPFRIFETTPSTRGTQLVRENLGENYTDMLIVGGDGTINEAVNGLVHDIPVSIIPAGSGNDFVKMISIGSSLKEQLLTATHGTVQRIDMGLCNDRKFVNGIGIGFDGQIVADMTQRHVPLLSGQAKYYYHVLHILSSYRERMFEMEVDNRYVQKELILLTIAKGTTFGGGFRLTPHASLSDGKLAVCEIGKLSPARRYLNLLKIQKGTHDLLREVILYHATQLTVRENPLLEGHIDGEYMGKPPFSIRILPSSLQIRSRAIFS
ncbi:MAG: diacylglycerol kinase family lipid kinase [Cyclobacteriaceae bacterium]|nr:diacylglycerol kinase family lipid kinase [Cyclobacteriaceae bacterium]